MNKRYSTFFLMLAVFLSSCSSVPDRERQMEEAMDSFSSPFGVLEFLNWDHSWNCYKYPDEKELKKVTQLMKQAGVSWVRMDFLWSDIEPQSGGFDFAKYDRIVDMLCASNIRILGLLNYSTDWASSCGRWNCPPQDNSLFINYAKEVIQRYKGRIQHWELWNEPDSAAYWEPQDGLKRYCVLLKEFYIAAKKIDPDCKILNGGLAMGAASVSRLYENGAKDYFDIMNIHIFDSPLNGMGAIDKVEAYPGQVYKVMRKNNDAAKKIWVTEIGCPGVGSDIKTDRWWMGKNPDEAQQAQWLKVVYGILLKNEQVEKVFWAFFRDCKDHWHNGVDYFGLVRWDYSKKPAFGAYRRCAKNGVR